jgi:hypothetical protein
VWWMKLRGPGPFLYPSTRHPGHYLKNLMTGVWSVVWCLRVVCECGVSADSKGVDSEG